MSRLDENRRPELTTWQVPNRALPFLGVHFTRRISTDELWTGPNSVLALGRRAYRPFQQLSVKDAMDTFSYR